MSEAVAKTGITMAGKKLGEFLCKTGNKGRR